MLYVSCSCELVPQKSSDFSLLTRISHCLLSNGFLNPGWVPFLITWGSSSIKKKKKHNYTILELSFENLSPPLSYKLYMSFHIFAICGYNISGGNLWTTLYPDTLKSSKIVTFCLLHVICVPKAPQPVPMESRCLIYISRSDLNNELCYKRAVLYQ